MSEGVVVFNPENFRTLYPQFTDLTDAQLTIYFNRACLLLDNSPRSRVTNLTEREMLLNFLVCHIATLIERGDTGTNYLTSTTEGSVSASFGQLPDMNWYKLTPCGYLFWLSTAKYRQGVRWYEAQC